MKGKKKLVGILILSVVVLIVTGTFTWANFSSQTISQWLGEGSGAGEPGGLVAEEEDIEVGGASNGYHSENGEYASSDIGFIMHTAFSKETIINIVAVRYTATPSMGAIITQVSYSINGHAEELLYQADIDGLTAKDTLGRGDIFLVQGENEIVFTARDSAGNIANYFVQHRLFYDDGLGIPPLDRRFVEPLPSDPSILFANNRLRATTSPVVRMEQVSSVVESIGGRIVGRVPSLGWYAIEVDSQTEEGLRRICEELMYAGLFSSVELAIINRTAGRTFN